MFHKLLPSAQSIIKKKKVNLLYELHVDYSHRQSYLEGIIKKMQTYF